ncbi:ABC transporter permease [Acetobacter orleanensis]|nr:ABC transporter permease subunit [Acetobacter orleanensis]KXV63182.1 sulfonate ABC transporter permease [Acetobacter orleanensis]PCD80703.1 sulfonate ABC transporter permease [Acetobacter orleanensis]GBR30404.1 ABC transporter anion transporter permease [Acetobacter orleanensis NRIC 0473]
MTVVKVSLLVCLAGLAVLAGYSVNHTLAVPAPPLQTLLHLDILYLPDYAARTSLRMFIALGLSLAFSFLYATLAAKSRRAAQILVPLLDILHSIPALGFLGFTVAFFLGLFPGQSFGAELAVISTVFASQAWTMTSGMYHSLRTIPTELEEAARCFGLTSWQKFWRLDVPCAIPALVRNAMISMAGGWFVLVYSETIAVGHTRIALPGIGSYVGMALSQQNIGAVLAAILAMIGVILAYNQLLFRPLTVWASRFRLETTEQDAILTEPWMLRLLRRTHILRGGVDHLLSFLHRLASLPLGHRPGRTAPSQTLVSKRLSDGLWLSALGVIFLGAVKVVWGYGATAYTAEQILHVVILGFYTLLRVVSMLGLASLLWVPLGVWLGLNPARAQRAQMIVQSCAAFPANLLFPLFVATIIYVHLTPAVWLTPLLMLGAQWYIVFNVINGTASFPADLLEAGETFKVTGFLWWRKIILPGITPAYLTGVLAASGSAWNAAIAAEAVQWGHETLKVQGLGAYIAQATTDGDLSAAALGLAVMTLFILALNWLVWRPLSDYAYRRLKLI